MQTPNNVKYTAILPVECIDALKGMAERKQIPSVNQGIREALERYIDEERRAAYRRDMAQASEDPEFLRRTMDTQEAFSAVDGEEMGEW